MWIMTPDGFYSIVQKKPTDEKLCVRARNREDLKRLCDRIGMAQKEIIYNRPGTSDYPYRIYVDRFILGLAVGQMVEGIDYSNFKNEAQRKRGRKYHDVLSSVWATLLRLETPRKRQAGQRRFADDYDWDRNIGRGVTFGHAG